MASSTQQSDWPLRYRTPDRWADLPLRNLPLLLSDHAYLERKAASNALELLNRWPEPEHPPQWTAILSSIARDEAGHLHAVTRLILSRGGKLQRLHRSGYANELRQLVRRGRGKQEILDRLLVSALIEARSCERFEILSRRCESRELAEFYRGLWSSELGHYRIFMELGEQVVHADELARRWNEMLDREARIIAAQPAGPGLHSGVAP